MTVTVDLGNQGVRVRQGYVQIHMATEYYWNPSNGSNIIAITKVLRTHPRTHGHGLRKIMNLQVKLYNVSVLFSHKLSWC